MNFVLAEKKHNILEKTLNAIFDILDHPNNSQQLTKTVEKT